MDSKTQITEKDLPQTFVVKLLGRKTAKGLWGIKNIRTPVDELVAEAKSLNLSLPVVHLQVTSLGIHISHLPQPKTAHKNDRLHPKIIDQNANNIEKQRRKKLNPLFNTIHKFNLFPLKGKENELVKHCCKESGKEGSILKTDFVLLEQMKEDHKWRADKSFFGIDAISYGVQDLVFTRVFAMIVISEEERSRFHCYAFICEDRHIARNLTYSLAAAFQVYSRSLKGKAQILPETPIKSMIKPTILTIDLQIPYDEDREKNHLQIKCCDSEA